MKKHIIKENNFGEINQPSVFFTKQKNLQTKGKPNFYSDLTQKLNDYEANNKSQDGKDLRTSFLKNYNEPVKKFKKTETQTATNFHNRVLNKKDVNYDISGQVIVFGNSKLGPDTAVLNFTSALACPSVACQVRKYCYAIGDEKLHKQSWERNVRNHRMFFLALSEYIKNGENGEHIIFDTILNMFRDAIFAQNEKYQRCIKKHIAHKSPDGYSTEVFTFSKKTKARFGNPKINPGENSSDIYKIITTTFEDGQTVTYSDLLVPERVRYLRISEGGDLFSIGDDKTDDTLLRMVNKICGVLASEFGIRSAGYTANNKMMFTDDNSGNIAFNGSIPSQMANNGITRDFIAVDGDIIYDRLQDTSIEMVKDSYTQNLYPQPHLAELDVKEFKRNLIKQQAKLYDLIEDPSVNKKDKRAYKKYIEKIDIAIRKFNQQILQTRIGNNIKYFKCHCDDSHGLTCSTCKVCYNKNTTGEKYCVFTPLRNGSSKKSMAQKKAEAALDAFNQKQNQEVENQKENFNESYKRFFGKLLV